ncbi:hypothetical protein V8C40DRAFT_282609 [Trichoderma camerunense]
MSATNNSISSVDDRCPLTTFSTLDNLFEKLETTTSQGLIVDQVSRQTYESICAERAERRRRYRFFLYLGEIQDLIITMPNPCHDAASRHLDLVIARKIKAMGLSGEWLHEDSITYLERFNGDLLSSGEANLAGRPRLLRPSILHDWPTIVVDFGPSNSMPLLRKKAGWWLRASGHEVRLVLLFEVNTSTGGITIEQWRAGPSRVQKVTIRRVVDASGTIPVASYEVFRGPLWLNFRSLFLRPPRRGSGEMDVVIGNNELQRLAKATWRAERLIGEA